ncbi:SDR family NAD(P)-dependent oxidoreductase [Gillisia sp. CAL575]|uniref:SDR family NAD(P)-dependent oxidoreductase n=1 Tax=Gillisia sp. CAL575 TaxID=985255 RepID=UPI00039A9D09|nr:SDR family NAD(P)-dependent oxidoreductase [Gillisia sp. CAL575]
MQKVFIITGANRGLGKAFADILIQNENHFVISISRSQSDEQKTYEPENFYFLKSDLSENTLEKNIQVLKGLIANQDIYFINNASIIEPITKIEHLDENAIDKTISVNIKSTMLITKYLLRNFSNHKLSFVNISSGAANRAISNWSLYCASKAFVKMFFDVAESEYEQHRFFNIDPGVMDTNMQKSIRENDFPDSSNFKNLQEEGKLKSPKDVALEILNTVL